MDPKDIPKKYGGDLQWECGDMPDLDAETREALERDGNKGWVRGPCLWLDGKRVPVGSEKGKPRRPNFDIEKLKPVVYAADHTETPVHAEKKASAGSRPYVTDAVMTAPEHHKAEEHTAAATGGATMANTIAANTNSTQEAQVPLPQQEAVPASTEPQPIPTQPSQLISSATVAYPPSQPQPGPVPDHTAAMTSATEEKLGGESVLTIPATANGHMNGNAVGTNVGHPEVVVDGDASKGLTTDAEKLKISDVKTSETERPPMDRFVTATEV